MLPDNPGTISCQQRFHQRWGCFNDPHVRALAWLLEAPDLLDAQAPRWEGKIATLAIDRPIVDGWLAELDAAPDDLHACLAKTPTIRLGRYAEKLLTFYFGWTGTLVAHGLQVQAAGSATIGEFDFLLRYGEDLHHLELATKFYLFEATPSADAAEQYVGPNLADTLGAKMHKILQRQLALATHPAARAYLPQPVASSQALIKGWLFYRDLSDSFPGSTGVSVHHCRGYWCSFREFQQGYFKFSAGTGFFHLTRLAWLAPASVPSQEVKSRHAMLAFLEAHFSIDATPLMVAFMEEKNSGLIQKPTQMHEFARCFIVPDDWRERANERSQRSILKWETKQVKE